MLNFIAPKEQHRKSGQSGTLRADVFDFYDIGRRRSEIKVTNLCGRIEVVKRFIVTGVATFAVLAAVIIPAMLHGKFNCYVAP